MTETTRRERKSGVAENKTGQGSYKADHHATPARTAQTFEGFDCSSPSLDLAVMVKLVDTLDLESCADNTACRFDSGLRQAEIDS